MKTVAKILVFDAEENALVLKRSGTHPSYPHEADLPGGIVEEGEPEETAVRREAEEETGLVIPTGDIRFAHRSIHTRNDVVFTTYIDAVRPPVNVSWEHESYEWVPPDELEKSLETADDYMEAVREYLRTDE